MAANKKKLTTRAKKKTVLRRGKNAKKTSVSAKKMARKKTPVSIKKNVRKQKASLKKNLNKKPKLFRNALHKTTKNKPAKKKRKQFAHEQNKLSIPFKKIFLAVMGTLFGLGTIGTFGFVVVKTMPHPLAVKVMVFTTMEKEAKPWLTHENLPREIHVPGTSNDVFCNNQGLCVAVTGEGKTNAAASITAILLDKQFTFDHAYFLSDGIAGVSPSSGTLGFAAWAKWIVDWDQGSHFPSDAVTTPFGYIPNALATSSVYHLNEDLVHLAYNTTKDLKLKDSQEAIANRLQYPGQENKKPFVTECDTITGDDFWNGTQFSQEAQYIMSQLTKNQGNYCTTEQEDSAIAASLQHLGFLNRYLSLRTASDFDQPYTNQSVQDAINTFPAQNIAIDNAYTVGSAIAHYLMRQ